MRTLEERERLAYISGRAEEAAVLGEAIDLHSQKILDLDWELRNAKDEIQELERQLAEYEDGRA